MNPPDWMNKPAYKDRPPYKPPRVRLHRPPRRFNPARMVVFILLACLLGSVLGSRR